MGSELDQYLSIQRALNPGKNFKQMMQSRKFGSGSKPGFGAGRAMAGSDGYAVTAGRMPNVLGNEARISEAEKAQLNGERQESSGTERRAEPNVALDKSGCGRGRESREPRIRRGAGRNVDRAIQRPRGEIFQAH